MLHLFGNEYLEDLDKEKIRKIKIKNRRLSIKLGEVRPVEQLVELNSKPLGNENNLLVKAIKEHDDEISKEAIILKLSLNIKEKFRDLKNLQNKKTGLKSYLSVQSLTNRPVDSSTISEQPYQSYVSSSLLTPVKDQGSQKFNRNTYSTLSNLDQKTKSYKKLRLASIDEKVLNKPKTSVPAQPDTIKSAERTFQQVPYSILIEPDFNVEPIPPGPG